MRITATILFAFLGCPAVMLAQIPTDLPHQTEPVDFSDPGNIALFIGVPVLMIIAFVMIRRWRRRNR